MSPSGQKFTGFKVTISDGLPPAKQDYIAEQVSEILHSEYKVTRHSNTNLTIESI